MAKWKLVKKPSKKPKRKPAKKLSPTQYALKKFRDLGYTMAITERWNPYAKIRQDLFGFIDLLAIKPGEPVIAIQATSTSNVSARIKKIKNIPEHLVWLETGARILVVSQTRLIEIAKE